MFETYAVAVVLASGGRQELPRLHSSSLNKKVMTSDIICTQAGIDEIQKRLKKVQQKKIVIIGGSHSAFSAAWICLNKLGWPKHAMSAGDFPNSPGPSATSQIHSIYIIHRTPIKVYYATKREAERDNYSGNEANKQGQIHPFSGLRGDAKQLFNNIRTGAETRVR
jgi:lysine/ornithine N-monooxygenase